MRSLALGFGMDPDVIDQLTTQELRDVINARRAWEEYFHRRPAFEAARITGWMSLHPYMKEGSQQGPADIYPLDWDSSGESKPEPAAKPLNLAEAAAMFDRFN